MYRLPTALAPYASHPEPTQFHSQIEECASELAEVGALARERDVRPSTHPGQYTVLNSERVEVRAAVGSRWREAEPMDALVGPSGQDHLAKRGLFWEDEWAKLPPAVVDAQFGESPPVVEPIQEVRVA